MNDQIAASQLVSPAGGSLAGETEEPPSLQQELFSKRHPQWRHVPDDLWQDWRWQRQNAIRTTAELAAFLPATQEELDALQRLEEKYRIAIPPYYFSLIDLADPRDPIRLQAVPSVLEADHGSGIELDDPLEEE